MATYLLSGEVLAPQTRGRESDTEDVDMDQELNSGEEDDSEYDGDNVSQTKMVLVNERDLESTPHIPTRTPIFKILTAILRCYVPVSAFEFYPCI